METVNSFTIFGKSIEFSGLTRNPIKQHAQILNTLGQIFFTLTHQKKHNSREINLKQDGAELSSTLVGSG